MKSRFAVVSIGAEYGQVAMNMLWVMLFAVVLSIAGCGSDSSSQAPVDPASAYKSALLDATWATPAEVYTGLTPITADNTELIWENNVVGSRVLVASWIKTSDAKWYNGTADPTCKPENCPVGVDLWVTVAPEMKDFFSGTVPSPLRVAQLLGVTPEAALEDRSFVELWVSPKDLFRPCPDPEITDRQCQPSSYPVQSADYPYSMFWNFTSDEKVLATEGGVWEYRDYKGWFENRTQFIYSYPYPAVSAGASLPYPWTRLGYTYDWGNPNHIGLSEFVLHGRRIDQQGQRKPAMVGVRSIKTTVEYFAQ
ncbi:MAG: hypothetical protein FIA89_06675 [Geobacter sp.]|nr:hypothetical protein [Geobacter sp.]